MKFHNSVKDFQERIKECVKCGACQSHCPVYQHSRREGAVARGKIALAGAINEGRIELEERLQEDISLCLLCGSCVAKCPNKVPTDHIVAALRREITDDQGLSLIGKGVATVTANKTLLKTLTKTAALARPALFKTVPPSSGLRLRFPVPAMKDRTLPPIARKNLFDLVPEFTKGSADKPVVGFFAGCAITYLYPEIGRTIITILQALGYSVYLARDQGCCGLPALSSGSGKTVEALARNNLKAFSKYPVEAIITACASCHGMTSSYYRTVAAEHDHFTGRIIDIHEFLINEDALSFFAGLPAPDKPLRVTYHDPCHLKVHGITKPPRTILKALPGIEFVEMAGSDQCCGLGGTFSVYHYDIAKAIGSTKVDAIVEAKADIVATACPGCIMQLQDALNHRNLQTIQALHVFDVVRSYLT